MTNTYVTQSVATTQGFIPQIWAQEALPILRSNINLAKFVAKDSDFADFQSVGSTLNIGYAGTFAAQDKVANTLLNASVPSNGSTYTVSLNKYKVVPFVVENIAQAQSNQDLMRRLLEPAVVALAEQVENDLFAAAYSFSPASIGTIGTDMTSASVRSAAKALNTAKAPQTDRHLIISPKDLAALQADSALQNYFAFSAPDLVQQGTFAKALYGFDVHMSQLVPAANSGTTAHSVQTVTITGTSGSFTLTYKGQTTASINYGDSGASVEAKLQALSTIGTGMARVSPYDSTNKVYTIVLYDASPAAFTHTDTTLTAAVADAASTVTATSNVAIHKNAMILAVRPVKSMGGSTVMATQIEDPLSGLVLNMEAQYNAQAMGLWVNLSILYGVAPLRVDQAAVVLA